MGDLLKEAIADAKAVRETALANAKMALEEAFTPQLKSMLSAKLKEDEFGNDEEEFAAPEEDEFGGEEYTVPIQAICRNDPSLNGTFVSYIYIENKLTQIRLERNNMNDRKLLDYAMKKYGKFNLPQSIPKEKWRGSHYWRIGNDLIIYAVFDIPDGQTELIEITSTLYAEALNEYYIKKEEWQNSQK